MLESNQCFRAKRMTMLYTFLLIWVFGFVATCCNLWKLCQTLLAHLRAVFFLLFFSFFLFSCCCFFVFSVCLCFFCFSFGFNFCLVLHWFHTNNFPWATLPSTANFSFGGFGGAWSSTATIWAPLGCGSTWSVGGKSRQSRQGNKSVLSLDHMKSEQLTVCLMPYASVCRFVSCEVFREMRTAVQSEEASRVAFDVTFVPLIPASDFSLRDCTKRRKKEKIQMTRMVKTFPRMRRRYN